MTFVATGIAVPRCGLATSLALKPGAWTPTLTRRSWAVDPLRMRSWQPAKVKVDLDHTNTILGQVVALERLNDEVWATALMNGPIPSTSTPLFWSVASNTASDFGDGVIERVAVVERTAMLTSRPLTFVPELRRAAIERAAIPEHVRGVLLRAEAAHRERGPEDPLLVLEPGDGYRTAVTQLRQRAAAATERPPAGPWHHSQPYHGIISVR